jgi:phosphatidylcholine synthase
MRSMWMAASVHFFTALGVICALFATRAVVLGNWETVFLWLGLAFVIDGIDGTFARRVDVARSLPRFSGDRLDQVVDYITYVFVPTLALLQANILSGAFGVVLASLILLSSLYHFSDLGNKSEDHFFVGFPAIWNIVAFYIFVFAMPTAAAFTLIVVGVGMTFIPLKWVHPMRVRALWPLTGALMLVWFVTAFLAIWHGFPAKGWLQLILAAIALYGVGLAVLFGPVHRHGE